MVSVLDSGSGGAGSRPSLSHSAVFLGKTLNSYKTSLHPDIHMEPPKLLIKFNVGSNPAND